MTSQTEPTDSWGWMEILREHPEKAAECPCWDEFTECDWEWLKEFQEQLVDKYKGNFDE